MYRNSQPTRCRPGVFYLLAEEAIGKARAKVGVLQRSLGLGVYSVYLINGRHVLAILMAVSGAFLVFFLASGIRLLR